uniref:Uncharacterized protein n=1 Tax=Meloidogyne hapla TaxID=6305 RepID=A0A1I8B7Y8_MELHA
MYFTNFTRGGGSKREERGRSSKRGKNTNQTNPYLHQGYDDSTSDTGHGTSQSNIPIGSSSEHDIGPTAQPISNELQNLDLFGNYPFHFQSWAATNPTDLPLDNFDIFGHDLDQFSLPVDPSQTTFSDQTFQQESVPEPETVPNQNARYNLFKKYIEQLPISSEIYEVIEEENDYYIYCNKCGVKVNQKNYSIGNRVKVILKTHNNKYHGGYLTEEHKNELKKWLKELGQEGKYFKIEENTNNLICKVCDVKLTPYDKKAMTYHLETDKHIIAFNETKHLSKGKMFQQYIEQLPIDSEIYEVIEEENDYYIYCNKCGVNPNRWNYW